MFMKLQEKDMLPIYEKMLLIRKSELCMLETYQKGEIVGHMIPAIGQEAPPATLTTMLEEGDYLLTGHRGGGYYIAHGCDFNAMWCELYGRSNGALKGRGGQLHLMDISKNAITGNAIVGQQWGMACGFGFAAKYYGKKGIVEGGEASTNRGTFHEGLNMAAVFKLPMLFVVEFNGKMMWNTQDEFLSCKRIASRAHGYDIPGKTVDGNDPFAIYEAASEMFAHIEAGNGPCLLECITSKWRDTVGNLRDTPENIEKIKAPENDPICRFEVKLRKLGVLNDALEAEIKVRVEAKLAAAVEFAKNSPKPDKFDGINEIYSQYV
ncbi:MAG: thiamine pyrophosphate-dependent dehydrogenase E1 component subunit alpha [Eubacteriales bacterium]|nr:thiamine pyrophosphate-dependent dehydrogenase E1 component subunit alpha [Eubacteriales bacterium]